MMRFFIFLLFIILFFSCSENDQETISDINSLSVKIITPTNAQTITPNNQLEFRGQITAISSLNFSRLKAVWSSDASGILNEGSINKDGETKFTLSGLSKNIHTIRLNIYNEIDDVVYDEIVIYNSIWLYPISDKKNTSSISWSKAEDSNFNGYDLYRSFNKNKIKNREEELIYSTNNLSDTIYIDDKALLGNNYYYRVYLKRKTISPVYVGSNIDSITLGDFKKLDFPISKIIRDADRNFAYGLVNIDNIYSTNSSGYGLVFINLETKEVSRILQNNRFTDLDIDASGNYLYLCSRSNLIHKVNLTTKQLESSFSIGSSAHKIEVGNNNKLYYHNTPPSSGSTRFRIYDLANNKDITYSTTIPAAYQTFSHGDFELDANQNIFHGESNSSSAMLSKISTDNNTFSIAEQWDSGRYKLDQILLNNNKIYWNYEVFDSNLNRLGIFKDENENINIETVSPNGNLALGYARLFSTNNFTITKEIAIRYSIATFTENNQILFVNNEELIGNENISTLFFYNF